MQITFGLDRIIRALLLVSVCLAVNIETGCSDSVTDCGQKLSEVQREFDRIKPPQNSSSYGDGVGRSCNYGHVTIGQLYQSELSFEQVRAYYDQALRSDGWNVDDEYGDHQILYSKGKFTAFVKYTRSSEYRFYFRVSLGEIES